MKYLILFLIFSASLGANSQTWELKGTHPTKTTIWDIDPLGNIVYTIDDVLYKLDTNLRIQFKQNYKTFGTISSLDATHALKTLIFSENMQEIAFLDNTLTNTNGFLDLGKYNIEFATKVCSSLISTRFWVYDEINSKLIRFDEGNRTPLIIENVDRLMNSDRLLYFFEADNKVYLVSELNGIFVFDNYGSFIKKIDTKQSSIVDLYNNNLYYLSENNLILINKEGKETNFKLPIVDCIDFKISGNIIYLRTTNEIKKYSLKFD